MKSITAADQAIRTARESVTVSRSTANYDFLEARVVALESKVGGLYGRD